MSSNYQKIYDSLILPENLQTINSLAVDKLEMILDLISVRKMVDSRITSFPDSFLYIPLDLENEGRDHRTTTKGIMTKSRAAKHGVLDKNNCLVDPKAYKTISVEEGLKLIWHGLTNPLLKYDAEGRLVSCEYEGNIYSIYELDDQSNSLKFWKSKSYTNSKYKSYATFWNTDSESSDGSDSEDNRHNLKAKKASKVISEPVVKSDLDKVKSGEEISLGFDGYLITPSPDNKY